MIYAYTGKPGNGGSLFTIGQLGNAVPESLAYNAHHFKCRQCQAAGRLTQGQRRCEVGNPLWQAYVQAVAAGAEGAPACGEVSAPKAESIVPPVGNTGGTDFRGGTDGH